MLLWWNRQTRLVRFACTRGRDIWVHADLPVAAVDERAVDRLLGLLVEAAVAVRERAARLRRSHPVRGEGAPARRQASHRPLGRYTTQRRHFCIYMEHYRRNPVGGRARPFGCDGEPSRYTTGSGAAQAARSRSRSAR